MKISKLLMFLILLAVIVGVIAVLLMSVKRMPQPTNPLVRYAPQSEAIANWQDEMQAKYGFKISADSIQAASDSFAFCPNDALMLTLGPTSDSSVVWAGMYHELYEYTSLFFNVRQGNLFFSEAWVKLCPEMQGLVPFSFAHTRELALHNLAIELRWAAVKLDLNAALEVYAEHDYPLSPEEIDSYRHLMLPALKTLYPEDMMLELAETWANTCDLSDTDIIRMANCGLYLDSMQQTKWNKTVQLLCGSFDSPEQEELITEKLLQFKNWYFMLHPPKAEPEENLVDENTEMVIENDEEAIEIGRASDATDSKANP